MGWCSKNICSSFLAAIRPSVGMSNAIGPTGAAASAVQGIARAGALHEQAATQVQRVFLSPAFLESIAKQPSEAPPSVSGPAATVSLSNESRDLAGALTDMTRAENLNAASVKVLQTTGEMQDMLIELKAPSEKQP